MKLLFRTFQSVTKSWETIFSEAAAFGTTVGPERLVGISHSEGRDQALGNGVVTVWYWSAPPSLPGEARSRTTAEG